MITATFAMSLLFSAAPATMPPPAAAPKAAPAVAAGTPARAESAASTAGTAGSSLPAMWRGQPTETVMRVDMMSFLRESREWIRADKEHDPALDEDLVYLLEAITPTLLRYHPYENRAVVARLAPLLEFEDCTHPIALLGLFIANQDAPWTPQLPMLLINAMDGLRGPGVPARLRLAAASFAAVEAKRLGENSRSEEYAELARRALVELARERAVPDPKEAVVLSAPIRAMTSLAMDTLEQLNAEQSGRAVAEIAAIPGIDPCLLETIKGTNEIQRAWAARGEGFADTVRPEAWEVFHQHLDSAYEHLRRAWELDPTRSEAASELIQVAMGGGGPPGDDCRKWFDRAVEFDPGSRRAYSAMAWALRPRWGGSVEAMGKLGADAVAGGRFDTRGPAEYLNILRNICEETGGSSWLGRPEVGARLEELAAGYARAGNHTWDAQIKAWRLIAAYARKDYQAAAQLLTPVTEPLNMEVVGYARISPRKLRFDSWALSGPTAPEVQEADLALRRGNAGGAAEVYGRALAKVIASKDSNERRDALEDRLATARMQEGLSGTAWYAVPVDARLHGWRPDMGYWRSPADGMAEAAGVGAPMRLRTTVGPGPNFEADVELLVWNRAEQWAESGMQFCLSEEGAAPDYAALTWVPNRKLLELQALNGSGQPLQITVPAVAERLGEPVAARISLQVWQGSVRIWFNGKLVHSGALPETPGRPGGAFAMGTSASLQSGVRSGFRNLKLRRLESEPAAPGSGDRGAP